jgi:hypothetical protein
MYKPSIMSNKNIASKIFTIILGYESLISVLNKASA